MTRPINLLVIHCSATPSGKSIAKGTPGKPGFLNAAQVINAWHAVRGFKRSSAACQAFNPSLPSIGYHFVIDVDGQIFPGRSLDEVGAHVQGFNANSLGICLVGGVEREGKYTLAQWQALALTTRWLSEKYSLPQKHLRWPTGAHTGMCGHRDLSPDLNGNGQTESREWLKTCPGFDVEAWLQRGMLPEAQHTFPSTLKGA